MQSDDRVADLVRSAHDGNIDGVRKLLKKGVDPNQRCFFGRVDRHETLSPTQFPSSHNVMGTLTMRRRPSGISERAAYQ